MDNDISAQELHELQVELDQIGTEFEELNDLLGDNFLGVSAESSEELDSLDAALEGSGLADVDSSRTSGQLSLLDVLDGAVDEQSIEMQWGVFNWLKKKVAKLIRKIVRLVKKYSKLKACIPAVTKAVGLFKAKKYASALKQAYSAYTCIKKRL